MTNSNARKITNHHLDRMAYVYVRQSSPGQVLGHVEGRLRQYQLLDLAEKFGWPKERIKIVDTDQGKSGANPDSREGFRDLITAVARGEVGIILALEASRLARNSPDWHNMIYMCRWSTTLIADETTIYDPTDPSDRMILGIRGQMAEMELENSIDRMIKARWNKAARGEFLTVPPAGYDIDELGRFIKSRDETVRHAIETVFVKFDELGSASQVYNWWREEGLKFPIRRKIRHNQSIQWVGVCYKAFLRVLHHPIYAGVYAFGRTKSEKRLDTEGSGKIKTKIIKRDQCEIFIRDHHDAYISYEKYLDNQGKIEGNTTMKRTSDTQTGAVREGACLLQGIALCGKCGRALKVSYGGHKSLTRGRIYQYRCFGSKPQSGSGDCQVIGGKRIDAVVVEAFIEVTQPAAEGAVKAAIDLAQNKNESLIKYWDLQIEKASYEVQRAFRQYDGVEPENRLVARTLEKNWEEKISELEQIKIKAKEATYRVPTLADGDLDRIRKLGKNLGKIWTAETTTNIDRKRLLRTLIEEVQLNVMEKSYSVKIIWKGGAITERSVPRLKGGKICATSEEDIDLIRKLAEEFDDAQIARTLSKQGRKSGRGLPYTKSSVMSIRGKNKIPACKPRQQKDPIAGPFTADEAAKELSVGMSTIQRWLRDGLLVGKQLTPCAPWQIILDTETRKRLTDGDAPKGWVGLTAAANYLNTSKAQVAYLVKAGKIDAVRTTVGKRTCWKIDVLSYGCMDQTQLFDQMNTEHI